MAVKVKVRLDIAEEVKKGVYTDKMVNELGSTIIAEIVKHTSVGLSPVAGYGRFVGYKGQTEGDKSKYPYNVRKRYPTKNARPVNLKLAGDMLKALVFRYTKSSNTLTIGIEDQEQVKKAEAHNEGLHPFVPLRKFLPTWEGETFTVSIQRQILDIVRTRIFDMIRKSNK